MINDDGQRFDKSKPCQLTRVPVECCPCSAPAAVVHDDDRQPAVGVEQTVVDVEPGAAVVVVAVVGATAAAVAVVVVVAVARELAGTAPAAAAGQSTHESFF